MKILVTIPHEHWIRAEVAALVPRLLSDRRYDVRVEYPCHRPYENNLHHIVRDFRESECDYWLNIDSDNPPICNPLDLIELDKDILGLPTPVWHYTGQPGERPIYWNAYRWDAHAGAYREWTQRNGLQQVDAVGSGCMVIARRVFEHDLLKQAPFERTLHVDGRVEFGADLAFCQRATLAGFKIYCHFDYPCRHFAEIDLHEAALALKGLVSV